MTVDDSNKEGASVQKIFDFIICMICYGNQLMMEASTERWLILPEFFALAFNNKLECVSKA